MFQTPSKCSTLAPPTYFVAHLCKFTWVWRGCAKYIRAATSISNFVNGLWHRQNNSTRGPWFRRRPRRKRERKESGATEPRRRLEDSQTIFKTSNFQVYKNWSVCHERRPIWDSSSVKSSWNGCINQKKKKKQTDKRLKDDGGRGGDEKGVSGRRASEREKDNIALI